MVLGTFRFFTFVVIAGVCIDLLIPQVRVFWVDQLTQVVKPLFG